MQSSLFKDVYFLQQNYAALEFTMGLSGSPGSLRLPWVFPLPALSARAREAAELSGRSWKGP